MSEIAAVIFDMDGVLIDSEPLWRIAELEVLHSYQIPLTEEMCIKMTGTRIDQLVRYYLEYYQRPELPAGKITTEIVDHLIDGINRQGRAVEGAAEVLEFCRKLGLKLGLASSSELRIIQTVLDKSQLGGYFDAINSGEFESHGKPHPAVYLSSAAALGANPLNCLAIEDSVNGVVAAKAARMKCVAIPEPDHRTDRRLGIADLVFVELRQIKREWQQIEGLFK